MRWFLVFLILAGVSLWGYTENKRGPYDLDYNKIAVNVPVALNSSLEDNKYPLGEKYLAENLRDEFVKQGLVSDIFALEDVLLSVNFKAGFEFYMRSHPELDLVDYHNFFDDDKVAILFETIPYKLEQVKRADIVFTGSVKKNNQYRKEGINSYFIPQFTRFERFYPAYKEEYKTKILFIANQWPEMDVRKSVRYSLNNGIDVDIYGANWHNVMPENKKYLLKGMQIANDDLRYYYSSADIVLNDTRDDMIEAGFISNRIFDVTACGGFIISDYIEGIEEIYGDAIPMYKTEEEFVKLIEYYLAHPEERKEKAKKAYEITKKNFGSKEVVGKMIEIMREYAVEKKLM